MFKQIEILNSNDEYYTINIGDNLIKISAATPHGIFNGTQTLCQC